MNEQSILLRRLGYGLFLLAIMDVVVLLVPPRFMNPQWEFNLVGNLVERSPVLLLGLFFIFMGGFPSSKLHKRFLKLISWSTLVIGILFFILAPICVTSAWRIDTQSEAQFFNQQGQQKKQVEKLQAQITQASDADLARLQETLKTQNPTAPNLSAPEIKDSLLKQLKAKDLSTQGELEVARKGRRNALVKQGGKWLLGTLIVGFLFVSLWRRSRVFR